MSPPPVICYTGLGARRSGVHTSAQFMAAMRQFTASCEPKCPTTEDGWIEWSGAGRKSEATCRRVVQVNRTVSASRKAALRAEAAFEECVAKSVCSPEAKAHALCTLRWCPKQAAKVVEANGRWAKASNRAAAVWEGTPKTTTKRTNAVRSSNKPGLNVSKKNSA